MIRWLGRRGYKLSCTATFILLDFYFFIGFVNILVYSTIHTAFDWDDIINTGYEYCAYIFFCEYCLASDSRPNLVPDKLLVTWPASVYLHGVG